MNRFCAAVRLGCNILRHPRQYIHTHIPLTISTLILTAKLSVRAVCTRLPDTNHVRRSRSGLHLVFGLGNPGATFQLTRHNIGRAAVQHMATALGVNMLPNKCCGCSISEEFELSPHCKVILATPETFINTSGIPVKLLSHRFRVAPEHIIVVHDDVDIAFGRVKVKGGGGAGGHNGVRSIVYHTGTSKFCRVKLGVGRPLPNEAMATHVLRPMGRDMDAEVITRTQS